MNTKDEASPVEGVVGPRELKQRTCFGCPALKTEWWKDYLGNDETDSGTSANCTAADGRNIAAYWHINYPVPHWCPAMRPNGGSVPPA